MDLKGSGNDTGPLESSKNDPAQMFQQIMQQMTQSDRSQYDDQPQVTFDGSITHQNEFPELHTFNDWLL